MKSLAILAAMLRVSVWAIAAPVAAQDWSEFRGPRGDGHSSAVGLPLTWGETKNVTWKAAVPGRGWSSPVVVGKAVWMTTAIENLATAAEKKQRLAGNEYEATLALATSLSLRAVCVHLETGELLHNIELFQIDAPHPIHKLNSYASPTPVVEAGRLYCDFGTYGTACLDLGTTEGPSQKQSEARAARGLSRRNRGFRLGNRIVWSRRLSVEHQVGPASSPVLYKDLLILVRDGCDRQFLTALDKRTGKDVWTTERPPIDLDDEFKKAFSTPLFITGAGPPQMIVPGAQWVVSYDPTSGQPIWRVNYVRGYSNVARPVYGHGMVYVCTDGPGRQLWAIRLDGQGDVTETHVAWKATRQIPKRPSPLLIGDELYVVSDNGVVTCFDAHMGSTHWSKRVAGNYAASPIFADGRIYFFNEEGKTTVLRPGKKPEQLAENQLPGPLIASPAVAGNSLLLRTDTQLYRVDAH